MAALLAMEIGAPEARQLEMWDKLAEVIDEDLVGRRVLPRRDSLEKQIKLNANAESIVEGQVAPGFTLANLEGEEVALSDVLSQNEFVLVDFWASWCGPCIATFPRLKKFYSAFNDDGFEIVAISIDSTHEAWADASEEHELPWMNLGEIVESSGDIANAYGVQFIPKGYLLDDKGCVIQKDLQYENLQEVLVARYGDDPILHASEGEAEASPTDTDTDSDDAGEEKSI